MTINVDTDICNLAVTDLGTYPTIMNITEPSTREEKIFSQYYDNVRRTTIKKMQPNFSLQRQRTQKIAGTPAFGYGYYYALPTQCLQLLGIGNLDCKGNNYSVEMGPNGDRCILSNEDYGDGVPCRYVMDVTDVSAMTDEFQRMFAGELAEVVCLPITQDLQKQNAIRIINMQRRVSYASLSAMENRPIRKSRSKFQESRLSYDPEYTGKR